MKETLARGRAERSRLHSSLFIVSLLLLEVAGHGEATGSAPSADPAHTPPVDILEFSLHGGFVTGTVAIPSAPARPRPAILQPFLPETLLLQRGFVVVRFHTNWQLFRALAPRAPPPPPREGAEAGKPVGKWMLTSPSAAVIGRAYFSVIGVDAASTVPSVLDHLERIPEIDSRRIGIAGSSTAGFVALESLVHDNRLAAAVVRVACGDYHEFLKSSSLALGGDEQWLSNGELALDPDYEASLAKREPIRFPNVFPPRAVLMLNGGQDLAIPIACARRTADALKPAYARRGFSERFRFVVYDDRGHDLGPGTADEVLAWWERWLLDGH